MRGNVASRWGRLGIEQQTLPHRYWQFRFTASTKACKVLTVDSFPLKWSFSAVEAVWNQLTLLYPVWQSKHPCRGKPFVKFTVTFVSLLVFLSSFLSSLLPSCHTAIHLLSISSHLLERGIAASWWFSVCGRTHCWTRYNLLSHPPWWCVLLPDATWLVVNVSE